MKLSRRSFAHKALFSASAALTATWIPPTGLDAPQALQMQSRGISDEEFVAICNDVISQMISNGTWSEELKAVNWDGLFDDVIEVTSCPPPKHERTVLGLHQAVQS